MTLYITDLDGTLLDSQGQLPKRACELINRMIRGGVMFSFATARGFKSARARTADLQLVLPLITMNGTMIVRPDTGEIIHQELIEADAAKIAYEFMKKQGETPLVFANIDGRERVSFLSSDLKRNKKFLDDRKGDQRLRPCEQFDQLFEGEVFHFCLINPLSSREELDTVFTSENGFATNYQQDTYHLSEYWYEIYNKGASKAAAVQKLKQLVRADKVVVFGDNNNDFPMFSVADECYAVENALPELKKIATAVIPSNNAMGVARFIERDTTPIFEFDCDKLREVDKSRYKQAIEQASQSAVGGIGMLNEKMTHRTLKYYFSKEFDHEGKVGTYYADIIGENGIIEIQTKGFNRLCAKLEVFLNYCHVTVVYPYDKIVQYLQEDSSTGELVQKTKRKNKDMSEFFLELYRIKSFLTNPNLTICIAELEVNKLLDTTVKRKRRYERYPSGLVDLVFLENAEDYRQFLPSDLPETFTRKQFGGNSIIPAVLEMVGLIEKVGKKGNAFVYKLSIDV